MWFLFRFYHSRVTKRLRTSMGMPQVRMFHCTWRFIQSLWFWIDERELWTRVSWVFDSAVSINCNCSCQSVYLFMYWKTSTQFTYCRWYFDYAADELFSNEWFVQVRLPTTFQMGCFVVFFCLGWARVGYSLEFEIIFGTRRIRRSTTGFSVVWWTHTSIGFPEWMHRCNHLRTLPQNITKIRSAMSFLLSLHRFRHPFRAFSLSRSETIGLICHFRTRMFLYLFSLFVSDGKKRIIGWAMRHFVVASGSSSWY